MPRTHLVDPQALQDFVARIFAGHGVPQPDAERTAACLVEGDLRGVASHGVGRVPIYTERLRRGLVNPRPAPRLQPLTPVAARLDADVGHCFLALRQVVAVGITDYRRERGLPLPPEDLALLRQEGERLGLGWPFAGAFPETIAA